MNCKLNSLLPAVEAQ